MAAWDLAMRFSISDRTSGGAGHSAMAIAGDSASARINMRMA
ncbi:hypothetical protein ACFQFQ_14820 [Sulfitobacter porphyrae]|uniref:Uncharacterized protein n=1 Tax=Sulfitobacter porphyrae TaxID=1246864 RepID=A0ABW2B4I3_9RHOB